MDYRTEAPPILRDFLGYHETIQGHSRRTVDEYYLDLRNFFRFLKQNKNLVPKGISLDDISIADADLSLVRDVTLTDIYSYMNYLSRERGLNNTSRARKVATIRSFYKYLTNKAKLLESNPVQDLDSPRLKKTLPKYLNLEESLDLLNSVDGKNSSRDYCILTLFLNCGLRISELVGLNKTDVRGDQLRVLGKGNKERMLYLNDACQRALEDWITAQKRIPTSVPRIRFVVTASRMLRILAPAAFSRPSLICFMPSRKSPSPPISDTITLISIITLPH